MPGGFGHREDLELAWQCLGDHSTDAAEDVMASAVLGSDAARAEWVTPDLRALPDRG